MLEHSWYINTVKKEEVMIPIVSAMPNKAADSLSYPVWSCNALFWKHNRSSATRDHEKVTKTWQTSKRITYLYKFTHQIRICVHCRSRIIENFLYLSNSVKFRWNSTNWRPGAMVASVSVSSQMGGMYNLAEVSWGFIIHVEKKETLEGEKSWKNIVWDQYHNVGVLEKSYTNCYWIESSITVMTVKELSNTITIRSTFSFRIVIWTITVNPMALPLGYICEKNMRTLAIS